VNHFGLLLFSLFSVLLEEEEDPEEEEEEGDGAG